MIQKDCTIAEIDFATCYPLWQMLWSDRKTSIEPVSHMAYLGGFHSEVNEPIFLGLYWNEVLIGCNSFHKTGELTRSRGLFVLPKYRQCGFGLLLLNETIVRSTNSVWSYPRAEALNVYLRAGFAIKSEPIFDSLENKTNFFVSTLN